MLLHHFYKKKVEVKEDEPSIDEKISMLNDKISMLESRVTTLNKVIALSLDSVDNELLKLRNRITQLEIELENKLTESQDKQIQ